jgi:hypothetical protein
MQFFVDALEIKHLCLWQRPNWSHGEHFWDQEEAPMISGALIQEESGKHAANSRSQAATRARYDTWLDPGDVMLEVKNNACLPAFRDLFDCDLMIGHGFDLRINGMAVGVEGLAGHDGSQVRRIEQCTVKGAAQQTLGIVQIEQLAEPPYEQIFQVNSTDAERHGMLRPDGGGVAHQVEHGPGGVGEELGEILPIRHHTEITSVRQWLVNVWMWCIARHGLAFDDTQRT